MCLFTENSPIMLEFPKPINQFDEIFCEIYDDGILSCNTNKIKACSFFSVESNPKIWNFQLSNIEITETEHVHVQVECYCWNQSRFCFEIQKSNFKTQ